MDGRREKESRADMSSSTGAKKAFSPSSVVEYARFPAKTLLKRVQRGRSRGYLGIEIP